MSSKASICHVPGTLKNTISALKQPNEPGIISIIIITL